MQRLAAKIGRLLPLALSPRGRAVLLHPRLAWGPVPEHSFLPDAAHGTRDLEVSARILRAYESAAQKEDASITGSAGDVWAAIRASQQNFFSLLKAGRAEELAAYLRAMDRMDATHGITVGHIVHRELRASRFARARAARFTLDRLLALAEAIGAVAVENPEQDSRRQDGAMLAEHLVDAIDKALAIEFRPPQVAGGALALHAGERRILDRDAMSLYTAWRMRQILGGKDGARVAEIGGGVGRVAYWYSRFDPRAKYSIFDLPHVNVLQAFYLASADPGLSLRLFGESGAAVPGAGKIHVLPHFAIESEARSPFNLVLNQDSFPEVNEAAVARYLHWIRSTGSRYLLSINHESEPAGPGGGRQLRVSNAVRAAGGFSLVSRHVFPLRRGYMEELYEVGSA